MASRTRKALAAAALSLVIVCLAAALACSLYSAFDGMRKKSAESVASLFQHAMVLKLRGETSKIDEIASAARVDHADMEWFPLAAENMLAEENALYVAYVDGETMRFAFPTETFGDSVGNDIASLSYVYTLAKVTGDFVIEGPVELETGQTAFLFIEPVFDGGVYVGETVIALSAEYVIDELGLAMLADSGFRYELWAVNPQDGSKDVIAVSDEDFDFSHAVKVSFNMPTQWTLSIIPRDGWVSAPWAAAIVVACAMLALLAIGCMASLGANRRLRTRLEDAQLRDSVTQLLTLDGFAKAVSSEAGKRTDGSPVLLICLAVEGFDLVASLVGADERRAYLRSISSAIDAIAPRGTITSRVGHGVFAIAVFEPLSRIEALDLACELELALLWKVRSEGEKHFCSVRSRTAVFPDDGCDLSELVSNMAEAVVRDGVGQGV